MTNNYSKEESQHVMLLKGGEISDYISKLITKASLGMIILAIGTIIQIIRYGIHLHYWILLVCSVLSILSLLSYSFLITWENRKKKEGILPMLIGFGAFIPYLFGCYLFFYDGIWRLLKLFHTFSWWIFFLSLIFIILGYSLVSATYKVTEFDKKIKDGSIRLLDSQH